MDFIELFKDWGGHIMSVCCIMGGLFMYFIHDKKLKRQELILNDLQIKQYKKTEDEEKQAQVRCKIQGNTGHRSIHFYNEGSSDARNVRVDILNDSLDGVIIFGNLGPYELMSRNDCRKVQIVIGEEQTLLLRLRITWDDDYANNRSIEQHLQL